MVLYDLVSGATITLDDTSTVLSPNPVASLAFSPYGRTLAEGDEGGRVVFFDASLLGSSFAQIEQQLCNELGDADMNPAQWAAYVPDQQYRRTCP